MPFLREWPIEIALRLFPAGGLRARPGNKQIVVTTIRTMRAACGDSRNPGMGNSTRALPTLVRVNRKPNIASTPKWTLTGILPQVAKEASGVVH